MVPFELLKGSEKVVLPKLPNRSIIQQITMNLHS